MKLKPYPEYKDSGVPWLGAVPKHWEIRSMGSLVTARSERRRPDLPLLSVVREKGVILRSTMRDEENHNFVPDDLSNYKVVRPGNLVVNKMKAWQGSLGVSSFDGVVSPAYFVYDFRVANLHFGHALLRSKPYVAFFAQTSDGVRIGQWDLSIDGMKRIPIVLPSSNEQAAIVRYLDHIDQRIQRYIRAKRRLIALLNEQKQATIHHAVTRGLDPNVRLKPSGVDWLGEVPEHWEIRRNGQLFVQRNETRYAELPILEVSLKTGVQVRNFKTSDRKQVMSDREKYKRAVKGDIAYNMMRMWQGAVGVAPVDGLVSPAYVVAIPRMGTEPRYFGYLFRIPAYMGEVDRCSRGIVKDRNRLYWEDFKQIPSPCPPTTEQARIADAIVEGTQALENTVEQVQGEISLLREYRTRLIADVVTGKLDVRNVELPELDEVEVLAEQDEETTVEDVNLDSESEEEDLAAEV